MLRFVLKGTDNEIFDFLDFLNQHFDSDDDKPYIMYSKDKDSELTISVGCDDSGYEEL